MQAPAWKPPRHPHLHYTTLYYGVYEYLLSPPCAARQQDAQKYLHNILYTLELWPTMREDVRRLQEHRVQWVREWIRAIPEEDYDTDSDTVVGEEIHVS